jgi:tRNA A-37 threonylcarbamoyl transferase component Bud32
MFSDFDLLDRIGAGASGEVYRARQRGLNRLVAVKRLRAIVADGAELERFRREARLTATLDHPNIVPILEVGEDEGRLYLVMKLIDGPDLAKAAPRLRKVPQRLAAILAKVARAVQHAHSRGVIHRDLKPSNIVLDADDQPYLVDFGVARPIEGDGLTTTQVILGTPAYLSPEQGAGRKDVGPAADVWGLGMILYEVLTGRLPFAGDTAYATLLAIQRQAITPPRTIDRKVPRSLERICLRCLRKKPQERYASAAQLAADLDRVSQGKALHRTWSERASFPAVRRWGRRLVLAGVLLGLVFGAYLLAPERWGAKDRAYFARHQEDITRLQRCLNHLDYEGMVAIIDAMPPWARESLLAPPLRRRYEAIRPCLRYTIRTVPPGRPIPLYRASAYIWGWSQDSGHLVGGLILGSNKTQGTSVGSIALDARTGQRLDEPGPAARRRLKLGLQRIEPIPTAVPPGKEHLPDLRVLFDRPDARLRLCFGEAPLLRPPVQIVVMPSPDGRLLLTGGVYGGRDAGIQAKWALVLRGFGAGVVSMPDKGMDRLLRLIGPEKAAKVRQGRAPLLCWNVWDLSKMPK